MIGTNTSNKRTRKTRPFIAEERKISLQEINGLNPLLELKQEILSCKHTTDKNVSLTWCNGSYSIHLPAEVVEHEEAFAFMIDSFLHIHFPMLCHLIKEDSSL